MEKIVISDLVCYKMTNAEVRMKQNQTYPTSIESFIRYYSRRCQGTRKTIHKLRKCNKKGSETSDFSFRICLSDDDLGRNEGHSTCKSQAHLGRGI